MGSKRWNLLRLLTGVCLVSVLAFTVWRFSDHDAPEDGMHFVLIMPEEAGAREQIFSTAAALEDAYDLRIELHAFPSAGEQKRLLRLLPKAGVDGVLLWPVSVNDADYTEEMEALQEADVPVVVVDRDVQQILRDSFIGSGYRSDLLVLSQCLRSLEDSGSFVVGNRFEGGEGPVAELLFFRRGAGGAALDQAPQDAKLRQMAEDPPDGCRAVDCRQVEKVNDLQLKQLLMDLFSGAQAPKLFFSLDETLSAAAAAAKRDLGGECGVYLLCYGDQAKNQTYLDSGVIDGLVTSLPEVSVTIGVRYLRDICRGFWVPASMDSGITLLTTEELEKSFLMVSRDE